MASFGMGFVHAMLIDIADGSDRGSTWDRERRLTDTLVETTLRFDDRYEPSATDHDDPPSPPSSPPGGIRTRFTDALTLLQRALPAR
jgi:hypothetical protein